MSVLPGSTGYVLLSNSSSFVGNIATGGFGYAIFNAVSNGITPLGATVNFSFEAEAGQYNQYSSTGELSLVIGQPAQYPMTNTTFSTCGGVFFDPGGATANYSNNQDMITTIHAGSPGAKLRAIFTEFSVEPQANCGYDYLNIYNGPSVMDPLVGSFCGNQLPDTITSTSSVGSLTFMFHSDYQHTFPGWAASLKCMGGPLQLNANSFPANVCEGGSSQLVAIVNGGSNNYTYEWAPSTYLDDPHSPAPIATPLTNISYTVTVSDGTNTLTSSPVSLTVGPRPAAPVITLNGNQLVSDHPTGNQWYINGNLIPNATGQTYSPVSSGDYTATVTEPSNNCESAHSNYITWLITGQYQYSLADQIRIFPNPAQNRLTIELPASPDKDCTISLSDESGRVIIAPTTQVFSENKSVFIEFDVHRLKPGAYFLTLKADSWTTVRKVMIIK
jgi:hypothetical protein